jgi:hypothetical protein
MSFIFKMLVLYQSVSLSDSISNMTRQQMVSHLFFALTVSIRSWVLFPTLVGLLILSLWVEPHRGEELLHNLRSPLQHLNEHVARLRWRLPGIRYLVASCTGNALHENYILLFIHTPEIACDQTAMGLPPVTSEVCVEANKFW